MALHRRRGVRQLLLDIHLYLSLGLGGLIVAVALTGAPLVWRDHVDRALNPSRYAVTGDAARLPPSLYIASALAAAGPDFRAASLRFPEQPGWPLQATMRAAPANGGGARSLVVFLDPPTGVSLGVVGANSSLVGVLHNFHHMLMVPQFGGRQIVGWIGVAMLLLSLSGLWLWWPRHGGAIAGLGWRRTPWTTGNLHHLFGFWISIPLAVVSLTGIYLAFPKTAHAFMSSIAGMSEPMRHGGYSAMPLRETRLDADRALAQALTLAPGATPVQIAPPVAQRAEGGAHHNHDAAIWRVRLRQSEGGELDVLVDDDSSIARNAPGPLAGDRAAAWIAGIHEGRRGGAAWAIPVFLTGVLPLVFLITGVTMWLRKRARRRALDASPDADVDMAAADDKRAALQS
ncbi:MAG TPA: PepSY-associated TM helix domain-containing protein [Rhodoblastus sp.]|nr:PepSY-associated TM helix domain-containing protein [Rhodoblastus sp.]